MIKHATTKEQSRRLIAAGVPLDTADMSWSIFGNLNFDYDAPVAGGYNPSSPAWGLMALMMLLPYRIADNSISYDFTLTPSGTEDSLVEWDLSYYSMGFDVYLKSFCSVDIFEVYVRMIEWLANSEYNRFLSWEKQ